MTATAGAVYAGRTAARRQDQSASGNTSDDVLAAHIREHGLAEEFLDETSSAHQFVFGLWRRGVPSCGITWEVTKQAGRVLLAPGRRRAVRQ